MITFISVKYVHHTVYLIIYAADEQSLASTYLYVDFGSKYGNQLYSVGF